MNLGDQFTKFENEFTYIKLDGTDLPNPDFCLVCSSYIENKVGLIPAILVICQSIYEIRVVLTTKFKELVIQLKAQQAG